VIRNSRRVVALAIAGAFTLAPAVSGCSAGRSPETASPSQLTEGVNVATDSGINIRNLFVLGPTPGHKLAAGTSAAVYAAVVNDGRDGKADKLVTVSSPVFQQSAQIAGGGLDLPPGQLVRLGSAAPEGKDAKKAAQQKAGASGTGKPDAKSTEPTAKPSDAATETPSATPSGAATGSPAADPTGTPGEASTGGPDTRSTGRPAVILTGLSKDLLGGESIELTLRFERGGTVKVLVPVVPHAESYLTYAPAATPTSTSSAAPGSTSSSGPATSASPFTSASPEASGSTGPAAGGSPSPSSAAHG
jgi:hypothetical protein